MEERGQGKLLWKDPATAQYKNDTFKDKPPSARWILVEREPHPETFGKNHADQQAVLEMHATALNLDPTKPLRSTPIETILAYAISYRHNKKRVMLQRHVSFGNWLPYHWSNEQRTSSGSFVRVGSADADGMSVGRYAPSIRHEWIGVLLSRRGA